jgi:hypothetical protein
MFDVSLDLFFNSRPTQIEDGTNLSEGQARVRVPKDFDDNSDLFTPSLGAFETLFDSFVRLRMREGGESFSVDGMGFMEVVVHVRK